MKHGYFGIKIGATVKTIFEKALEERKMGNKAQKENKKLMNARAVYAVVASLAIAIVGVVSVIYNLSKIKNVLPKTDDATGVYTVPTTERQVTEFQANVTATGIPDERDTTSATEKKTMIDDLNRPYTGKYLLPLDSSVTKSYSNGNMVFSKTMNDWRTHDGIDIGGNLGDNAVAIQDGKVTAAYTDTLWGDVVEIEHGNGLTAKYCGVKSELKENDTVSQGQVIGTVTAIPIEKGEGTHVHLETSVEQKTVDPIKAMNLMAESTDNATVE